MTSVLRLICTSESGEVTSMQAVVSLAKCCLNLESATMRNVIGLAEDS